MIQPWTRRQAGKWAAAAMAGAAVAGFDRATRTWIAQAQAATTSFEGVPKLDGELLLDDATRKAVAVDAGNVFHRMPAAVLRPASVQDIVKMVQYANQHHIKFAIKGQGHSQYGQTQAEAGIVLDSAGFNAVGTPTPQGVDVQPGALWGHVATATVAQGLTPRVFPATCMTISVGGTLNAGGIGTASHHFGALVDNVLELDVVTGDGRLVTCSPARESELFDMVLGGMGQCGIIVRARLPLVPAPTHVAAQDLTYIDLERYLADQSLTARDGRFDHQRGTTLPKANGLWSFLFQVAKGYSGADSPDLRPLVEGLGFDSAKPAVKMTYLDFLFRFEARNAANLANPQSRASAYVTMWIPASATKEYVTSFLAQLPDSGGFSLFSVYAMLRRRFTRPLFKVPTEDAAFAFWLFRDVPAGDANKLAALMKSNRELLDKMKAIGGKRYPPYATVIPQEEWQAHFGAETWQRFRTAKRAFDPNDVLSPEPAMFA